MKTSNEMSDSDKLRLLANWFDKEQKHRWSDKGAGVQNDLRRIANELEELKK